MSSQNEDERSLDKGSKISEAVLMKPKLSYSREFLLSLSNLDICKKLPNGFDESLISEFEDALTRGPDRPRVPGSLPLHGIRRNEYGTSPPTRGDADSGRRFGHQSRRPWQTPEHDGLLGSGLFTRPPGHAAGASAPKLRANEHSQLSRSNEPYHPPRPYKAVPYSRRDTDSYNDETFGSTECTSEDRAEAEKRRRASFEMMRKEQQKVLQEKQKSNLDKHKRGAVSDLCGGLVDSKEEKGPLGKNNELEVSGGIPISSNDLEKPFASHSPASRPLIPPGFKTNTLEKSSGFKFLVHPPSSEVAKPATGESLMDADANLVPSTNGGLERRLPQGQPAENMKHALLLNNGENANVHDSLDMPMKRSGMEDQLFQDPETAGANAGVLEDKTAIGSNRNYSTSILEKIFGSTLSVDDGRSNVVENYDSKPEDTWSPASAQSSKFAQWFFEEEVKTAAEASSSTPNDLLSLIVSGDKVNVVSDQVCINNKEEAIPAVLTCEDLEQSILSEYSAKTTNVQAVVEGWSASTGNSEKSSTHVDDCASLQLLSMLQKSTDQSDTTVNPVVDINLANKPIISLENDISTIFNNPNGDETSANLPALGRTLTLETLFGTVFMKELQSVDAPVSVKRDSIGSAQVDLSEPHGFPFPITDKNISSMIIEKSALQRPNHDYSASPNHPQHTKASEAENWLGFDNFSIEETTSKGFEYQLPEEENLLTSMPNSINNVTLSSIAPINITDKLTAFDPVAKDDRSVESSEKTLPFPFDSYEKMEPSIYRNMQVQQSSPRFQPPQMPHARPLLYNHLEPPHPARMGSQPKFLSPELIVNHDSHGNHQISSHMISPSFHHPNVRVAGFDVPPQHSVMHHQMQMAGNHPPQFPRGFHVPHNGNQAGGFIQEMNRGFPFGPHQPNIGGRGIPVPGNPPEAFQRLVEMEFRANSKQNYPLAPSRNQEMMHAWL